MNRNKYQEVYVHFNYAEKKIKQIERLNGEGISIPSVNQLRYAGQHILTAINSTNEDIEDNNIYEALDHCKRATYDALEIGILYFLNEIKNFKEDYIFITVTDVIPDYLQKLLIVKEIQSFVEDNNRNSIENSNDLDGRYKNIIRYFDELESIYNYFDISRVELTKKITNYRRNTLITFIGILLAILTLIFTVILK